MTGNQRKKIEELLYNIINDKTSGSSFLAEKIKKLLKKTPDNKLIDFSREILKSHFIMAAVVNEVNISLLERIEGYKIKKPKRRRILLNKFWKNHSSASSILTVSYSKQVIELLKESPRKLKVFCGISHPKKEGLILKKELNPYHDVNIIEDAEMCRYAELVDIIIFGADLITENYLLNKIGSFQLAVCGKYFKKKVVFISTGNKYLTEEMMNLLKPLYERKLKSPDSVFEKIPINLIDEKIILSKKYSYPLSKGFKESIKEIIHQEI